MREAELKEKEAAFARLSKEVEEFPGRLQREVQQGNHIEAAHVYRVGREATEEMKRQVQEIAVKAIEGASGAKVLAHIEQIVMEQAKTRTQP
ncbi:MAG: hypothetical protein KGJ40_05755 [candidate division NC10 bacterium]|nr:hypothetical protein [candidate division NC10 bacterium]